jgi:hypothetical protein
MEWVMTSYEANDKNGDRRRSARVWNTAEVRTVKNKAMMLVIQLEDHL